MYGFSAAVRQAMYTAQNGICIVDGCTERIHSFHHKLHNTKPNRNRFPLLIHSVINCVGVCQKHHDNYPSYVELNLPLSLAVAYENFLAETFSMGPTHVVQVREVSYSSIRDALAVASDGYGLGLELEMINRLATALRDQNICTPMYVMEHFNKKYDLRMTDGQCKCLLVAAMNAVSAVEYPVEVEVDVTVGI